MAKNRRARPNATAIRSLSKPSTNGRYLRIPAADRVEETAIPRGTLAEEIGDIWVVVNDND